MEFVASFHWLVKNVCLLAPTGMLRSLPQSYLDLRKATQDEEGEEEIRRLLAVAEDVEFTMPGHKHGLRYANATSAEGDALDYEAIVQWQYSCHEGHAASFASTLLHGPVLGQEETWLEACRVLKEKHSERQDGHETLLVICGQDDTVVPVQHVREDLDRLIGRSNFRSETVPGGHGFPLTQGDGIVDILGQAWRL